MLYANRQATYLINDITESYRHAKQLEETIRMRLPAELVHHAGEPLKVGE